MSIKVDIRTEQEVFEYITNVMLGEDIVQNLKSRFEDEMNGSVKIGRASCRERV